ncbi:MAG: twin-arginine translocase TatA/TatE family subunit [Chloroflexota bacterium]|nr:twin-arginine translocase TatA/TatE family subunit [Chloroflexota bacterium]
MPFGLGGPELILILLVVMLVFGASRIPELGRGLGTGIREFKDSVTGKGDDDTEPRTPELKG